MFPNSNTGPPQAPQYFQGPLVTAPPIKCSVFQLYLVNFKWLKFIPPTANSCYLGQNISWDQKIFQKFWFLDIPMSCQSFLKNHLVKWPFSVAIWSGKKKFNFLQLFCFKLCFCFLGINFVLKMWSFEIYYVDVM